MTDVEGPTGRWRIASLDVWDRWFEVRTPGVYSAAARATSPPTLDPRYAPTRWEARTDLGTVHNGLVTARLVPSLPQTARRLTLSARSADTKVNLEIELRSWPPEHRPARVRVGKLAQPEPGVCCGTRLPADQTRCDECHAAMSEVISTYAASTWAPSDVIPLNADLGQVGEVRMSLDSIEAWPDWFNLRCHWRPSGHIQGWPAELVGRWRAEDDLGGHYRGFANNLVVSFAPAPNPNAQRITLIRIGPDGHDALTATVELLPGVHLPP